MIALKKIGGRTGPNKPDYYICASHAELGSPDIGKRGWGSDAGLRRINVPSVSPTNRPLHQATWAALSGYQMGDTLPNCNEFTSPT
jgi:hypothetical protein